MYKRPQVLPSKQNDSKSMLAFTVCLELHISLCTQNHLVAWPHILWAVTDPFHAGFENIEEVTGLIFPRSANHSSLLGTSGL